ncbi:hypothetical protein [Sphingobacterium griseoflavum]|uniref:Uncharacterized protein n=1 Tax=Sphingobacterium griseoflavum TaxID=1474952 RepID=A0ABQ3HVJ2_9SPHI|nr:hypothetical protein [Sphingobacterium griseoflavum]GHE32059.1 hypothetical protein GCM10017764_14040 [Sphingobacterium griseoflavum]
MKDRLEDYNKIYGFREHPERFGFEGNPERIIVRNTALREADASIYVAYLTEHYPASVEREMEQFEKSLTHISLMPWPEANSFFEKHGITTLQTDIPYVEHDAVFVPKTFSESEADALVKASEKEPFMQYLKIDKVANRSSIWLDVSELLHTYAPHMHQNS